MGGIKNETPLREGEVSACSVYLLSERGVEHRYFKWQAKSGFEEIKKMFDLQLLPHNSRDTALIHFASFDSVPKDSGIFSFRKILSDKQIEASKHWEDPARYTDLLDVILSDPDMNHSVAFTDDHPSESEKCGHRCTTNMALSTCQGDLSGKVWTCRPSEGPICSVAQVSAIAVAAEASVSPSVSVLHEFRDQFLKRNAGAKKYIGYNALVG
ncbi:hypothetical protein [Planctomycetes bacterium K23_9]|uniref:hypothetical protein n=1 Tax=Stieleria marina TaxID=1930275 RepID=UPI00119FB991